MDLDRQNIIAYSKAYLLSYSNASMPQVSKISSKGQVTVPAEVRRALGVKAGDVLIWNVESKDEVVVRRARPVDVDYLAAVTGTLSEWDSTEDDEAFRDL